MIQKICERCGKSFLGTEKPNGSKICKSCVQKAAAEKRKKTCIKKYGVDNIMKLPNSRQLVEAGFQKKYGDGVRSAMDIPESREKFEKTMIKKYGVPYYVQTNEWRNNSHFRVSKMNEQVKQFLEDNGYRCSLEYLLEDKLYDIRIEDTNILIEIDPSYTHSIIPNHWSNKGLQANYHLDKSIIAERNCMRCIHIFDWDDWKNNLIDWINGYEPSTNDNKIVIDRSKFSYKELMSFGFQPSIFSAPNLHYSRGYTEISKEEYINLSETEKVKVLPVYDCGYVTLVKTEKMIQVTDCTQQIETFQNVELYETYMKKQQDLKKIKICEFCGKPFIPNSNFQRYCKGPHYRKCPVCGKDYLEDNTENLKRPPVACSYECRAKKTRETSLKKYGVVAPGNNKEARAKARETFKKHHGCEYTLQSKELYDKAKQTLKDRYNVDNAVYLRKQSIRESIPYDCRTYGVEMPSYDKMVSITETSYLDIEHIRNRIKETSMKRYGIPYYIMLPDVCKSSGRFSKTNHRFAELLDKEHVKYEIEYRIDSSFYDFYLPQSHTLIEIDPTYTHSLIENHWGTSLDPKYHINKSKLAEINGFRCFHIFDWDNPTKFIKSLIQKKIVTEYQTREVSKEAAEVFLSSYSTFLPVDSDMHIANIYKDSIIQLVSANILDDRIQITNISTKFYVSVIEGLKTLIDCLSEKYNKDIYYVEDSSKPKSGLLEASQLEPIRYVEPEVIWSKNRHAFSSSKLFLDSKDKDEYISKQADMLIQGFRPVMNCGYRIWRRQSLNNERNQ